MGLRKRRIAINPRMVGKPDTGIELKTLARPGYFSPIYKGVTRVPVALPIHLPLLLLVVPLIVCRRIFVGGEM